MAVQLLNLGFGFRLDGRSVHDLVVLRGFPKLLPGMESAYDRQRDVSIWSPPRKFTALSDLKRPLRPFASPWRTHSAYWRQWAGAESCAASVRGFLGPCVVTSAG